MRRPLEFLGEPLPGAGLGTLRGKLLAFEGPAAAGKTTQMQRLKDWLEAEGYAVSVVGVSPMEPAESGDSARALRELAAFSLTLETEIFPALGEGHYVLADGYVFSWIARMQARGLPGEWLRGLAAFALTPHAALYLRAKPEVLMTRAAARGGFGAVESAMDLRLGADRCESFLRYQERTAASLDGLAADYGMRIIDGEGTPDSVFRRILREVRKL